MLDHVVQLQPFRREGGDRGEGSAGQVSSGAAALLAREIAENRTGSVAYLPWGFVDADVRSYTFCFILLNIYPIIRTPFIAPARHISLDHHVNRQYYNRYANHEQSAKLSQELHSKTEKKMSEVLAHSSLSWIEVQFLRKAVDVVVSCRTTLKWTYAFAYYLARDNQTAMFEDNQRDLEMAVEQLSELMEKPIETDADKIAELKRVVQDKSVYCGSRREVVLEDTAKGLLEDRWKYNTDARPAGSSSPPGTAGPSGKLQPNPSIMQPPTMDANIYWRNETTKDIPLDLSLFLLGDKSVTAVPAGTSHSQTVVHLTPTGASALAQISQDPRASVRFSTANVLSMYRNAVAACLRFRNAAVPDATVFLPASGRLVDEKVLESCEQTNLAITSISWPSISSQPSQTGQPPEPSKPHFTVTSSGAVQLTSLDSRSTITVYPHVSLFWVSFPALIHDPDGEVDEHVFRRHATVLDPPLKLAKVMSEGSGGGTGLKASQRSHSVTAGAKSSTHPNPAQTTPRRPSATATSANGSRSSPVRKSVSFSDGMGTLGQSQFGSSSGNNTHTAAGAHGLSKWSGSDSTRSTPDQTPNRADRMDSGISLASAESQQPLKLSTTRNTSINTSTLNTVEQPPKSLSTTLPPFVTSTDPASPPATTRTLVLSLARSLSGRRVSSPPHLDGGSASSPTPTTTASTAVVGRRRFRYAYARCTQGPFSTKDPPKIWEEIVALVVEWVEQTSTSSTSRVLPRTSNQITSPLPPPSLSLSISPSHTLNATYVPPPLSPPNSPNSALSHPFPYSSSSFLNATHPPARPPPLAPQLGSAFPARRVLAMARDGVVYRCVHVQGQDEVFAVAGGAGVVVETSDGGRYASTCPIALPHTTPRSSTESMTDMYRTHALPARGWNRVTGASFPLRTIVDTCLKILQHNTNYPLPPRSPSLNSSPPTHLPTPPPSSPPRSPTYHASGSVSGSSPIVDRDHRRSNSLSLAPRLPQSHYRVDSDPPPLATGKAADVVRGVGSLMGKREVADVLAETLKRNREVLGRMGGGKS
ncbi:hypothetical protein HDU93_008769 [Gonapodya sp. JEL0774]|nr:hypothetical protein HDU93_008769 [Gonapodya sp. JEL0774]